MQVVQYANGVYESTLMLCIGMSIVTTSYLSNINTGLVPFTQNLGDLTFSSWGKSVSRSLPWSPGLT